MPRVPAMRRRVHVSHRGRRVEAIRRVPLLGTADSERRGNNARHPRTVRLCAKTSSWSLHEELKNESAESRRLSWAIAASDWHRRDIAAWRALETTRHADVLLAYVSVGSWSGSGLSFHEVTS